MGSATNTNTRTVVKDGKRILYRLLLIAVAVVYCLVFVLDYILQLRFTFWLLSGLLIFVLFTLVYMWLQVVGKKEPDTEDIPEQPVDATSRTAAGFSSMLLPEALFHVNSRTGFTIDANAAAVRLFGATSVSELIGIDLTALFAEPWSEEENLTFRAQLNAGNTATGRGLFRAYSGASFKGVIQADRLEQDGKVLLIVRVHEAATFDRLQSNVSQQPLSGSLRKAIDEGAFPMIEVGTDYKIKQVNKAFSFLLAYREKELEGMSYLDLIHEQDRESERQQLSRLFRGELQVSRRDRRMFRRTNELMWLSLSSSLSKDEKGTPSSILLLAENITQRKRLEQTVQDSRSRLNDLIDNKEYGILSVDRHHTIKLLNPRLADFFYGMTSVVVETGFNLLDIIPTQLRGDYLEIHANAFAGNTQVIERELQLPNGVSHLELIVTPVMGPNGTVITVSFFAHDITSRKSTELTLRNAREKAEASTEAKSTFLATMSHEIRTPLNGVIGMGKLLSQTTLSPKQQEYVESILLSGEALLSVINDILDISKIESSRMELEHKPFALKRCIEETFDLLASKAIEKKLTLSYSIAPGTPSFIVGDITRLRQILMNLVSNAIKFTQRGGIVIQVSKVQEIDQHQQLLFEVKDTGIGIPAEKIDRLFRSYYQADASTARTHGGTGLGLAICKNLVELMSGSIWVKSKVGEGSVFSFTIQAEKTSGTDAGKDLRSGSKRLANANVLIVSDDRLNADVYANYFTRWNMIPHVVDDPVKIDSVLGSGGEFTLVLIDSRMSSMNPLLVAESIRSLKSKDKLPIVLFNAEQPGTWMINYTNDVVSAVLPQNIDRSKVLDILLGIFSIEDHQRARHDEGLKAMGAKLAQTIPARILIAEDNHINQKLAQNIFEGLGYKPVIVSNGREVVEVLRSEEFDVIFMDVQMPELDGLETTRFILNKMVLPNRPHIIAMTAFALEGDKEKCMEAGMDDYISKPFMIEEIIEQLRKWSNPALQSHPAPIVGNNPATRPVIDMKIVNALREMTIGSDPDFFFRVIQMFLDQAEQVVQLLEDALRYGNLTELSGQAHKLKGSALNIGASRLAEVCRQVELQSKSGETSGLVELMSQLKVEAKEASKILLELK